MILRRDGGLCQACKRQGVITPATIVDHIIEIKDGGCATCSDNLESLCASCHAKKTAEQRKEREGWG
ncbi:HNH endonuclease signature motif containing protein [Hydrogenimonas urashimensis]|uniref:HNH endonuclease n=1 Tax=Hydrogenimonas urashimensis TaxID=2740515 RepID=UPI001916B17C